MPQSNHLKLTTSCGACGFALNWGERVLGLQGSADSAAYFTSTCSFIFPRSRQILPHIKNYKLCCRPNCRSCTASPEFTIIHRECHAVFLDQTSTKLTRLEALDRLWLLSSWRSPWKKAPELHLELSSLIFLDLIHEAEPFVDGFRLSGLPLELLTEIWRLSPDALLWRVLSVIHLASRTKSTPLCVVPLGDVESWERHGECKPRAAPSSAGQIRVIIDAFGILKIERFKDSSIFSPNASPQMAFIVEEAAKEDGMFLCTKGGLSRLSFSPTRRSPKIWDIGVGLTFLSGITLRPSRRIYFRTIDLHGICGLTFFFSYGRLYQIYPHRSQTSSALSAMKHLTRIRSLVWIYTPVSLRDPIALFAVRKLAGGMNILIQKRRSGDICIGVPQEGPSWLGSQRARFLVYEQPPDQSPMAYIGTDSKFSAVTAVDEYPSNREMYYSFAPLQSIASLQIFYGEDKSKASDDKNRVNRGILFRYHDGGERAVGQCRVHVDSCETHLSPSGFYFQHTQSGKSVHNDPVPLRFRIRVQDQDNSSKLDDSWEYAPFDSGFVLNFWFTERSCYLDTYK